MSMSQERFEELLRLARAGDEAALSALLEHLEPEVRQTVRRQLPRLLRTQFDSMDFVQRVWTSVFADRDLDDTRFQRREHFLGYLNGVASNKVREEFRRRTRIKKYNIRREEPLIVRRGDRDEIQEIPAHDPTPSQDLQRNDRLEQLLQGKKPKDAEVIRLRVQGLTFDQIAARTGVNERTARRVIDELKHQMEEREWD